MIFTQIVSLFAKTGSVFAQNPNPNSFTQPSHIPFGDMCEHKPPHTVALTTLPQPTAQQPTVCNSGTSQSTPHLGCLSRLQGPGRA